MAGPTGFEPATSGLTGRRANQAAPRARHLAPTSLEQKFSAVNTLSPAPPLVKQNSQNDQRSQNHLLPFIRDIEQVTAISDNCH